MKKEWTAPVVDFLGVKKTENTMFDTGDDFYEVTDPQGHDMSGPSGTFQLPVPPGTH